MTLLFITNRQFIIRPQSRESRICFLDIFIVFKVHQTVSMDRKSVIQTIYDRKSVKKWRNLGAQLSGN